MKVKADILRDLGCTLSPQNAFYILNGIETLNLRMQKHADNALKVANYLQQNSKEKLCIIRRFKK